MANDLRLTDKQRELAAKNHNLIYWFAHKNNISIEEFYDVLAIGLCKAARSFDNNKGEFSTFAYRCIENELKTHWKSLNKKSIIPCELISSYDNDDYDFNLLEKISDCQTQDHIMYAIMSKEFIEVLNDKEKNIYRMLLNGMKQNEIADELNCKRQNVTYYVKHIREKANDYFGCY